MIWYTIYYLYFQLKNIPYGLYFKSQYTLSFIPFIIIFALDLEKKVCNRLGIK